jgi:hypothetical protein
MPMIDYDAVRNKWDACYPDNRLKALFDRAYTLVEVLTNKHGAWERVPETDRLWVACHVLTPAWRQQWLHAIVTRVRPTAGIPDAVNELADRLLAGKLGTPQPDEIFAVLARTQQGVECRYLNLLATVVLALNPLASVSNMRHYTYAAASQAACVVTNYPSLEERRAQIQSLIEIVTTTE